MHRSKTPSFDALADALLPQANRPEKCLSRATAEVNSGNKRSEARFRSSADRVELLRVRPYLSAKQPHGFVREDTACDRDRHEWSFHGDIGA